MDNLTVIVLAAGGGTRMKSKTMKVLHRVGGRSMVGHVLTAVQAMEPQRVVAVIGNQKEQVGPHVREYVPDCILAEQEVLDGTGGAVQVALEQCPDVTGTVIVLAGDAPLLRGESLKAFAAEHEAAERAVSILTGQVDDPFGYGRVIRNHEGDVESIVEEKDATDEQRAVREINSGILAFEAEFLKSALPRLGNDNAKGEYYLTDTVHLAREDGLTVGAHLVDDVTETEAANDRAQLARLGRLLNDRITDDWMRRGVTIMDPATTWIEADVVLEPDVTLLPGTQLLGATVVREDAVVGPDTTLEDCEVGAGARVVRTHGKLAVIGAGASVGPFAYLRPGTQLGADGKIGAFVETKNAQIHDGAKVPHLSYVGDAEIGEGTNIGAGTIFANYDGVDKHRTVVGRQARTGSNNTFVAPVSIGDGASTAGGTVVRRDVPPGALAVSSSPQRNIEHWAQRKRPGSAQAAAAAAADAPARKTDGEPQVSQDS
ncbi:bifunctional UDP-N-acetylglucosamine diphosphorylase/glucosamine-1-phosphate N-acetyltransferase GlmU [Nocardioides gansuensis]|uniref:Bifunctional protein GlmU n=1 Tax=Nocardioides gansuensis TaxID=2138300 RepID=A0A2T8F7P2_9ACTN|nr:bifunctional UDP-N-acetylglucosamine diphosphorylase/glucosamine-1-phosphate N-acetyltransferase GlmU [Nocardioides gansuensis]PVG81736.1 bifunctional UDP-N-acetylglucosamine diphosphorylase/glucosamine-1-phosphate N-acetyltransferase GlmU [Nocardioides gansuensis]